MTLERNIGTGPCTTCEHEIESHTIVVNVEESGRGEGERRCVACEKDLGNGECRIRETDTVDDGARL